MKRICKLAGLLLCGLLLVSCNNTRHGVVSYQPQPTECMGSELDGSYTVRAWGYGRYVGDAKEQAKKNAVRDAIFKGIARGQNGCEQRPVLTEVNAYEKYRDYFNRFFSDGGEYLQYISMEDRRPGSWQHFRQKGGITCSLVIRVEYAKLRAHLLEEGILKQ